MKCLRAAVRGEKDKLPILIRQAREKQLTARRAAQEQEFQTKR